MGSEKNTRAFPGGRRGFLCSRWRPFAYFSRGGVLCQTEKHQKQEHKQQSEEEEQEEEKEEEEEEEEEEKQRQPKRTK